METGPIFPTKRKDLKEMPWDGGKLRNPQNPGIPPTWRPSYPPEFRPPKYQPPLWTTNPPDMRPSIGPYTGPVRPIPPSPPNKTYKPSWDGSIGVPDMRPDQTYTGPTRPITGGPIRNPIGKYGGKKKGKNSKPTKKVKKTPQFWGI